MPPLSARTKWIITLSAPVLAVLLLEIGLRVAGFTQPAYRVPIVAWTPEQDLRVKYGQGLYQFDAASLWALRAGAQVALQDTERINSAGFRGPEPERERVPGTLRVALLGESSIYGLGVPWEQTCAPQLEALLAERGRRAEVHNFGVTGYTVLQGLARYRSAARPLRPDVVFVAFGLQNEHAACQARSDAEKLAIAHAQQEDGGRSAWVVYSEHLRVLQLANWLLLRRQLPALRELSSLRDEDLLDDRDEVGQVEWPGCRRVSLEEFAPALLELSAAVRADGARLILGSLPRGADVEERRPILAAYSECIERVGRALEVPVVDLRGRVREAVAAGEDAARFFLVTDNLHLGPEGQRLLAQELADVIEATR